MENTIESTSVSWPAFFTRNRKEVYFIAFESPDILRVNYRLKMSGETHEFFNNLSVFDVDVDNLKFISVWEKLSKETQDRLVKVDEEGIIESKERMAHARNHRRNKYPGVPHEVTCINCGEVKKMSPGMIVKKAEKIALEKNIIYTAEDFCKSFKCSRCDPKRRGRVANPNLPAKVELKCECGAVVKYPASVALKHAEKKGLTIEKYIGGFKCQICAPSKGRKKGKK